MRVVALGAVLLASCGGPKFRAVETAETAEAVRQAPPERLPAPGVEDPEGKPQGLDLSHYKELDWRLLRGLNVRTGELAPALRKWHGASVQLTGYMVPLSDDDESATQFLLVPGAGMCIHTPPPPANQIVAVYVTTGSARVTFESAVTVAGILEIEDSDSVYGKVGFRLDANAVRESR